MKMHQKIPNTDYLVWWLATFW